MNKLYPFYYFNGTLQKLAKPADLNNLIARFGSATIFETILIDRAKPILLAEHLARFKEAIKSVYHDGGQLTPTEPKVIKKKFSNYFSLGQPQKCHPRLDWGSKLDSRLRGNDNKEALPAGHFKSFLRFLNLLSQPRLRSRDEIYLSPSSTLNFDLLEEQINDLIKKNQADLARLNIYYERLAEDKVQLLICLRSLTKDYMKTPVTLKLQKANQRTPWHQFKLLGHQTQQQLPADQDLLFFNEQNEILETTRANVFFIKNNTLITPPINNIIPGVMRGWLIKNHANLGFGLEERIIHLEEIPKFEEIFLTNSLRGIIRVKALLK